MLMDRTLTRFYVVASPERRLMVFFAVAYFAQGVAGGLIAQPLAYYLKSQGMAADTVAQCLAIAAVPWMMKPLYGLLSDFVPLFGYRRKSYLILMAGIAALGFLSLTCLHSVEMIIAALLFSTFGIAACDVMVDALMVENGQKFGLVKQFQGQQWTWLNVAAITTGLVGGWLAHALTPITALQTAALLIVCAPIAVMVTTRFFVDERNVRMERTPLRTTARNLMEVVTSKHFWCVAGFLAFWSLIPNFGTPLYYHMIDHLEFDPYFIGQLTSIGSVGAAIGAFGYRRYLAEQISTLYLVYLSIALSGMMALAYLFLSDGPSAIFLYFAAGIVCMIPLLTFFSLAASVCPPRVAGFTFAALMAIYSAAAQVSAMIGAHLYEHVFHRDIAPLICVAAAFTLAAMFWVPFLPIKPEASGELGGEETCAA
ncbi:MAG TPA: MFS transporter [Nitrospiraceae bacterium]|nr:MFS transporter [Nitrospiraceae bacterium]